MNRQEQAIVERLGIGSGLPEEAGVSFESARLLDGLSARGQEPARYLSEGDVPALTLRYPYPAGSYFVPRLLAALSAVAVAVSLWRARRRRTIAIAPWVVALVLSLFTWLCLEPSALGLAVLLLSIAAVVTRRWRSARPERRSTLAT